MATYVLYFDTLGLKYMPLFGGYIVACFLMNWFFSFVPYFIVLKQKSFFQSMKLSSGLVWKNLIPTLNILLLMFLVNLRILVNVIVVFGVPIGIFAATSLFANASVWILSILAGILVIGLTSYIAALVSVFQAAVWYHVFHLLHAQS